MGESTVNSSIATKTASRTTKAAKADKPRAPKAGAKGKASVAAKEGGAKEGASKRKAKAKNSTESDKALKKEAKKTKAVKKRAPKGKGALVGGLSPEQRRRMIAEHAYFRAEQRGFQGGNSLEDWLAAEAEVDRMIAESKPFTM